MLGVSLPRDGHRALGDGRGFEELPRALQHDAPVVEDDAGVPRALEALALQRRDQLAEGAVGGRRALGHQVGRGQRELGVEAAARRTPALLVQLRGALGRPHRAFTLSPPAGHEGLAHAASLFARRGVG